MADTETPNDTKSSTLDIQLKPEIYIHFIKNKPNTPTPHPTLGQLHCLLNTRTPRERIETFFY